jgi:hypothetical protein
MKRLLMMTAGAVALLAANEANARLQLSISANGATFSCFDGQLGCDQSGGANNLLVVNTLVGGAFVELTLAQSAFGKPNELQLSSSNIVNESGHAIKITLLASDTNFVSPTAFIRESGSLTFNSAIGSGQSMLQFWADHANTQGANPLNTPGVLLDTVTGTPTTDPDSFSGSLTSPFFATGPFSMTEGGSLALKAGGSITGFNQSMESGVPEPKTWAMVILGFGVMALMGVRKARKDRLAPAI